MDGGPWWAAVHGVAGSWALLSDFTFTFHFRALEKEMATHSSVIAWRNPGRVEPGGLPSLGSHRVGHDWSHLVAAAATTQWTVAHQAPLFIGFFRQEYCSGLPCPPPGGRPDPEMEPASLTSSALAGETFTAKTIIYTQPNYNMLLMKCDLVSETVKCKP